MPVKSSIYSGIFCAFFTLPVIFSARDISSPSRAKAYSPGLVTKVNPSFENISLSADTHSPPIVPSSPPVGQSASAVSTEAPKTMTSSLNGESSVFNISESL